MIKNIFYIIIIAFFVFAVFFLLSSDNERPLLERLGVQEEKVRDATSEVVDTTRIEQGRGILKHLSSILGMVDIGDLRGRIDSIIGDEEKSTVGIPLIRQESLIDPEKVGWDSREMEEAKERGDYIGCGESIFYLQRQAPQSKDLLSFVYEELFLINRTVTVKDEEYGNPIAYHTEKRATEEDDEEPAIKPLSFVKVSVEDSRALVYLEGDYFSIGTCEPPRLKAVLEFAALQFDDIDSVEVYLNEEGMEFVHGGKD